MNRFSDDAIDRVFVYGTLKTGGSRESMWPCKPLTVWKATTCGALYDLGEYPAMLAGSDWVVGEVWQFASGHMQETLKVLDEIEGYGNDSNDLYRRVAVQCDVNDGESVIAHAYHYVAGSLGESTRIRPSKDGRCRWPNYK